MNLYTNKSQYAKVNAQSNLEGRTHYVDDSTLRFHKSRILAAHVAFNGLIFGIVCSDSLDMNNTRRGFRPVVFDLFGNVLFRPDLENAYKSKEAARKAMWDYINTIDAQAVTEAAIEAATRNFARDMEYVRDDMNKAMAQYNGTAKVQ